MLRRRRLLGRLSTFVASLLLASFAVFAILQMLPGDVAAVILGDHASPEDVAALRQRMGLDRPFVVRYLEWLRSFVTGDLGQSALSGDKVSALIGPRLGVTVWLVVLAMLAAIVLAVPLGAFAAVRRRHWSGTLASVTAQIGMAVPAFLVGLALVTVFAVKLRVLPASGYVDMMDDPVDWLRHMILPVASLALVQAAVLSRYVRSAVVEVLGEDYYRTARAVGWRPWRALGRHGARNAALNVVTVLGLQLATLLVGAIVIESVFQLPGLGPLLLSSVTNRDLTVVQSIVMLLVASVLIINTVVDVVYTLLDPRLRGREVSE